MVLLPVVVRCMMYDDTTAACCYSYDDNDLSRQIQRQNDSHEKYETSNRNIFYGYQKYKILHPRIPAVLPPHYSVKQSILKSFPTLVLLCFRSRTVGAAAVRHAFGPRDPRRPCQAPLLHRAPRGHWGAIRRREMGALGPILPGSSRPLLVLIVRAFYLL